MKIKSHYSAIFFIIVTLLLASCNASPESISPTNETTTTSATLPPTQLSTSTQPPEPTTLPTPTATPEPITCTIAFESNRDGNWDIFLMNADGSNPINLTNDPSNDFQPAISADGKKIAFVSNHENDKCEGEALFVINSDGGELKQLTDCVWPMFPAWSENGEMIAFSADGEIFIVSPDGSKEPINLTNSPEEEFSPVISPDNKKIAYLSGGSSTWNVYIMDIDGSNKTQLTSDGGEIGIDWSVDGRIFVGAWDRGDEGCCNFVMNPDGSEIEFAGGKGEMQKYFPFWTLDGDRVECVSLNLDDSNEEIYLLGETFPDFFFNLTNHPAEDRNPSWPANCGPLNTN